MHLRQVSRLSVCEPCLKSPMQHGDLAGRLVDFTATPTLPSLPLLHAEACVLPCVSACEVRSCCQDVFLDRFSTLLLEIGSRWSWDSPLSAKLAGQQAPKIPPSTSHPTLRWQACTGMTGFSPLKAPHWWNHFYCVLNTAMLHCITEIEMTEKLGVPQYYTLDIWIYSTYRPLFQWLNFFFSFSGWFVWAFIPSPSHFQIDHKLENKERVTQLFLKL